MSSSVRRRFVTVNGRQVHYRIAGEGPVVVLLHESPRSSVSLLPLMKRLASRYTVIGFDTPGQGDSDPLDLEVPEIVDLADGLAAAIRELGLRNCGLYGMHTGASLALEIAVRHRDLVGALALDGVPAFTPEETAELLAHYLPTFDPSFDGSHLIRLWMRLRDQYIFFPWYEQIEANRRRLDVPDAVHLQAETMEVLRAGLHYHLPYAAAFRHSPNHLIPELNVPTAMFLREGDVLNDHLDRLPPRPNCVEIHEIGASVDTLAEAVSAFLAPHSAAFPDAPTARDNSGADGAARDFADIDAGQILIRRRQGEKDGPSTLLFPDFPGSGRLFEERLAQPSPEGDVIAFDLPGLGDSDPTGAELPEVIDQAAALREVLNRLGIGEFKIEGQGLGAFVAAELALLEPDAVRSLSLELAPIWDRRRQEEQLRNGPPDLTPRLDGSHLLAAWNFVRDRDLFDPAFDHRAETVRAVAPSSAEQLHLICCELFKGRRGIGESWRAATRYAAQERFDLVRERFARLPLRIN